MVLVIMTSQFYWSMHAVVRLINPLALILPLKLILRVPVAFWGCCENRSTSFADGLRPTLLTTSQQPNMESVVVDPSSGDVGVSSMIQCANPDVHPGSILRAVNGVLRDCDHIMIKRSIN